MERELQAARTALESRDTEIKELRVEFFDAKSERMVSSRTVHGLEQQVRKLQKQYEDARAQAAAKDAMLRQCKEDSSHEAKAKRKSEAEQQCQSVRLNRALDQVQRFRKQLEDVKVMFFSLIGKHCSPIFELPQ